MPSPRATRRLRPPGYPRRRIPPLRPANTGMTPWLNAGRVASPRRAPSEAAGFSARCTPTRDRGRPRRSPVKRKSDRVELPSVLAPLTPAPTRLWCATNRASGRPLKRTTTGSTQRVTSGDGRSRLRATPRPRQARLSASSPGSTLARTARESCSTPCAKRSASRSSSSISRRSSSRRATTRSLTLRRQLLP
jgi:hypothetical protein